MLKLEHFLYSIKVVEAGSINKAAEELYISQPYLSKILKELESDLGLAVFTRTNKGVKLTEAGAEFLKVARELEKAYRKTEELTKRYGKKEKSLSVCSFYSFAVMDLFHQFSHLPEHGAVKLSYEEKRNVAIPEHLEKGRADIGVVYIDSGNLKRFEEEFTEKGMVFRPLFEEPLHIMVSSLSPLAQMEQVDLETLKEHTLIIEEYKRSYYHYFSSSPETIAFLKSLKIEAMNFDNNRSLMYYLAKSRNSFSFAQKWSNATSPFVRNGDLKFLPLKGVDVRFVTGCLYRSDKPLSDEGARFIAYLSAYFEKI